MSILDSYITKAPSAQNILDIFSGEWSSRLPLPLRVEEEAFFYESIYRQLIH